MRNNYATSLLAKGRYAEAMPHLRVAVERNRSFAEAEANLGVALAAVGKGDEGVSHLRRAILLRPDYGAAYRNLGEAYALQGRLGAAAEQYSKALEYLPDDVFLLNRTAWILATARDVSVRDGGRAASLAERAVRLTQGRDAASLDSLAAALAEKGEFEAAASAARGSARGGVARARRGPRAGAEAAAEVVREAPPVPRQEWVVASGEQPGERSVLPHSRPPRARGQRATAGATVARLGS